MEAASARQFRIKRSRRGLGYDAIQSLSTKLWLPMLLMAAMAFPLAVVFGAIRADELSEPVGGADTIVELRHIQGAFVAVGFMSVFGAISFAIGRILGQFRKGGGEVQEASGRTVETLERPITAWIFIGGMMAMMVLLLAAVLHFIFAADVSASEESVLDAAERFTWVQAIGRIGIAMYLASIALGLATIIQVLRFQAIRVRELPDEAGEAIPPAGGHEHSHGEGEHAH